MLIHTDHGQTVSEQASNYVPRHARSAMLWLAMEFLPAVNNAGPRPTPVQCYANVADVGITLNRRWAGVPVLSAIRTASGSGSPHTGTAQ